MPRAEMPIFTKTFDLLSWLLPMTNHFPKNHRHTFTKRLLDNAFDLSEHLQEADLRRGEHRRLSLQKADESLAKLRHTIRLAFRWQWLSPGQYEHVSKMLVEIGKLLGSWLKHT